MKKFAIFLILICLVLLSGCKALTDYREPEKVSVVSAIGFDSSNGQLKISIETAFSDKKTLLSAQGKTAEEAINNVNNTISSSLLLSHCAVIALGENLSIAQIKDILLFCKDNYEIPLSVRIIVTKDSSNFFNSKEETVMGYEILEFIENKIKNSQCPLYTVLNEAIKNNSFSLPYFTSTKNGYTAEEIRIKGVSL